MSKLSRSCTYLAIAAALVLGACDTGGPTSSNAPTATAVAPQSTPASTPPSVVQPPVKEGGVIPKNGVHSYTIDVNTSGYARADFDADEGLSIVFACYTPPGNGLGRLLGSASGTSPLILRDYLANEKCGQELVVQCDLATGPRIPEAGDFHSDQFVGMKIVTVKTRACKCEDYNKPTITGGLKLSVADETPTTEKVLADGVLPGGGTFYPAVPATVVRPLFGDTLTFSTTYTVVYGPSALECSTNAVFSIKIPPQSCVPEYSYREEIITGEWGSCSPNVNGQSVSAQSCSRHRSVTTITWKKNSCTGQETKDGEKVTQGSEACQCPPTICSITGVNSLQSEESLTFNPDCGDYGLVTIWKDESASCSNGPVNGVTWTAKDWKSTHDSDDVVCSTGGDYTEDTPCSDAEALYSFTSTTPIRGVIVKASTTSIFTAYSNVLGATGLRIGVVKDDNNFSNCDYHDLSHVEFCACPAIN